MNFWDRIKYEFNKGGSPTRKLIILNVGIFIIFSLVEFLFNMPNQFTFIFGLPSQWSELITHPWSIFTYMFMHGGIWHLLFNMLILFYAGMILLDFTSIQRFYTIYFGGGLLGGVLFFAAYNIFPVFTSIGQSIPLVGASAAIISVLIAAAVLVPNYEVFLWGIFRIRMKYLALAMVLIDLISMPNGNAGGHISHLGGALFGTLYILNLQGRLPINLDFFKRIRNPFKPKYEVIDESRIIRNRKKAETTKKPSNPFNIRTSGKPGQEEIDAILDKIGQSGYDSLSKEEKELLFRASE
ncbi:MAG: rhomboid family intramembrane serine protease [Flavobacteriales bacterium]|nr:rhomboid family intramembrane serine protease [Bacteroidota bacterium]MCB9241277.1 rhomboid family intramembrane serine protease [Flavobacteriales bacterium]